MDILTATVLFVLISPKGSSTSGMVVPVVTGGGGGGKAGAKGGGGIMGDRRGAAESSTYSTSSTSSTSNQSDMVGVVQEGGTAVFPSVPYQQWVKSTGYSSALTPSERYSNDAQPYFANTTNTTVTVVKNKTAYLQCHVLNMGTKSVSWVRDRDSHVLTVGRITFTNDGRWEATNKPGSDVWWLQLKFAQPEDSGKYQCQVSTNPTTVRIVTLNVVEPQAVILSGSDLFVDHGSPLNITCVIPDSPEPPEHLFWYHRDMMVYNGSRSGVTITTKKGPVTTSILFIQRVTPNDSGVYTCAPQHMKEASVRVRVLSGELPQVMQTGCTSRGGLNPLLVFLPLLLLTSIYHFLL